MVQPGPLAIMVRRTRGTRSLRTAGNESGISFVTLARIEQGYLPTMRNFIALCRWMDLADDEIKTVLLASEGNMTDTQPYDTPTGNPEYPDSPIGYCEDSDSLHECGRDRSVVGIHECGLPGCHLAEDAA